MWRLYLECNSNLHLVTATRISKRISNTVLHIWDPVYRLLPVLSWVWSLHESLNRLENNKWLFYYISHMLVNWPQCEGGFVSEDFPILCWTRDVFLKKGFMKICPLQFLLYYQVGGRRGRKKNNAMNLKNFWFVTKFHHLPFLTL